MIWIRLDTDKAETLGADEHPAHGEWIELSEAISIIREHNERKAREEQGRYSVLVDHARGALPHRYTGACPDSVEGPDVRDPECPVCRAIDSASRLRAIGPGEVVVPGELFQEAVDTADWMSKFECLCDESVGHICEACSAARFKRSLDALRPQKGGTT